MWINREITEFIKSEANAYPAVALLGSRQVGKSSLLRQNFKGLKELSFDLPSLAEEAENDGQNFLKKYGKKLFLDEIQYVPALFRYLKHAIDQDRNVSGQYYLTGSQKFELMQELSESLAGRISLIDLHTLSFREYLRFKKDVNHSNKSLLEFMFKGGYPEIHAQNKDPKRFYSNYVATYLERDLRKIINVKSLRDFDRFMRLLALNVGQLLSFSNLAAKTGVSAQTIKSWISALESSNVISICEPYFENFSKRIVKSPKIYFNDSGLACFLCNIASAEELEKSNQLGSFFENFCYGQILRHFCNQGSSQKIYFFRDHHGLEVDFLIPKSNHYQLIECKWTHNTGSIKNLETLSSIIGADKTEKYIMNSSSEVRMGANKTSLISASLYEQSNKL